MKILTWFCGCFIMSLMGTNNPLPLLSLNGCKDADSTQQTALPDASQVFTPEMFGAIGDGQVHKLADKYKSLQQAQIDYPGVKDLDITLDGAALQKAIDMAALQNTTVLAGKKYVINYPLITKSNVTIEGNGKGFIRNDNSREKSVLHLIFYFGNYNPAAFDKSLNNNAGFTLYPVNGVVKAGDSFVQLKNKQDMKSFKAGQLVMLSSASKRKQGDKKILLPYHITVCKITKMESDRLYFEYPIDETIESAEIAANGNYDPVAEVNFEGVENVTVRNMSFDAEHVVLRTYGYKCKLENLRIDNGVRLIGLNAFARSEISNISGTFGWRGIEVKTGTHNLVLKNINGTYKPADGYTATIDLISLGQYCRSVTIDSFKFDCGDVAMKHGLITIRSRKNVISNGIVIAKGQKRPFLELFNERYVEDPQFGCYGNHIKHVAFYGGSQMRNMFSIGDDEDAKRAGPAKDAPAKAYKKVSKQEKSGNPVNDEDNDDALVYEYLTDVAPHSNIIENCFFDAGSVKSVAMLNDGKHNIIRNCRFTRARIMYYTELLKKSNTITGNQEE